MSAASSNVVFSIDDEYDLANASDGRSRYGFYLADRRDRFRNPFDNTEPLTDPAEFAAHCFTIASSPIMSPGYVRVVHPRVVDAAVHWDDGPRLAIALAVAVNFPEGVAKAIGWGKWTGWRQRSWPHEGFYEPYDNDRAAAYTTLTLRVPINPALLPAPAYIGDDGVPDIASAKASVRAVAEQVHVAVADILSAVDSGGTGGWR